MKLFMVVVAVLLSPTPGYNIATAQYFGNCRGALMQRLPDVPLGLIRLAQYSPYLWVIQVNGRSALPPFDGDVAGEIDRYLSYLSQDGYSTVNLVAFVGGGWYIEGARHPGREEEARQAALENQRQEQARREAAKRDASRSNRPEQHGTPPSATRCEVRLYSDMNERVYCVEADIDVRGEYIEVQWGETGVNQGQSYDVEVHIESRSGHRRNLSQGQNWVDPGRYKVQLTYSAIRYTSVRLQFDCASQPVTHPRTRAR